MTAINIVPLKSALCLITDGGCLEMNLKLMPINLKKYIARKETRKNNVPRIR